MMKRIPLLLATVGLALLLPATLLSGAAAMLDHPAECRVAEEQNARNFALPHFQRAVAAKKLDVLVVGAGSSQLPGAEGAKNAYPARLQVALSQLLPGVAVTVVADVKPKRSAADMAKAVAVLLSTIKPALIIWQTGTVDAMQGIDPDQFSQALDRGIRSARAAGADIVFINPQYSPRTESMIALGTYAENMRWVALQQEVPLFDRFSIMKLWSDLGTFDLYSDTKKLDMAERVHDCIGRLLADFVVGPVKPVEPPPEGGRKPGG